MQGLPERRLERKNLVVMGTDFLATNTINNLPTNTSQVMAINNGSTATPPGTAPTTSTSSTLFLDPSVRSRLSSVLIIVQRRAQYGPQRSAKGW